MKKFSTIMMAALFVLALAGSAMADHSVWQGEPNYTFAVGGQFEIDGWALRSPDNSKNRFYNEETRVFFKGNWGDVTGLLRLEFDYDWDQANQNKGNTTQNPLDLAYIAFPLPYTPVKISAGLQPLTFGANQGGPLNTNICPYIDDSFYILNATYKNDMALVQIGTAKLTETYSALRDTDLYYGLVSTGMVPNNTIQVLFTYLNQQKNDDFDPMTIGLVVKGSMAPVGYFLEGYYQFGKLNEDQKLGGYSALVGVTGTVAQFNIMGIAEYTSGDDTDTAKMEGFQPISANVEGLDLVTIYWLNGKKLNNTWALALRGGFNPIPEVQTWAQVGYYNLAEKNGADSANIGVEIDLFAKYTINKYMTWKVTAGYLIAGDAFGDDAKDPYAINNEFAVLF